MLSEPETVKTLVHRKVNRMIQEGNAAATRAALARLRRGVGKMPGSIPELWAITLGDLPEEMLGVNDRPSYAEWAIYTVLTLFAVHQQGKDLQSECMHREGCTLGQAVRNLISSEDEESRVKHRFDAAVTADNPAEFSHHLRGLIKIMRSKSVPLDYAALAHELYRFQFADARDSIRLRWGRDFYRKTYHEKVDQESFNVEQ